MFIPRYRLVSRVHPGVIISQCLVDGVPRPRNEQVANTKTHEVPRYIAKGVLSASFNNTGWLINLYQ